MTAEAVVVELVDFIDAADRSESHDGSYAEGEMPATIIGTDPLTAAVLANPRRIRR